MHRFVLFALRSLLRIERDCTEWAHADLKRRLLGVKTDVLAVSGVQEISGDVAVCQRKGRLRHCFDLSLEFSWKSIDNSRDLGTVAIRDLMSDTASSSFEYTVRANKDTGVLEKEHASTVLKEAIWHAVQSFASNLLETQGHDLLVPLAAGEATAQKSCAAQASCTVQASRPSASAPSLATEPAKQPSPQKVLDCKSLKLKVSFNARPEDLLDALARPEKVALWSRGPLTGSLVDVGSRFVLFSGAIQGEVVEADKDGGTIVWSWKLADWSSPTRVTLQINPEADAQGTKLTLIQTGIPASDLDAVQANWNNYYWNPIKATFGYGAFLQY